ncbi:MAG: GNAT family N-acetyltransferase [Actinobacteria bacterium]|nr:GNAT family N-acetyltransferase [Actinomycetota bacterium]
MTSHPWQQAHTAAAAAGVELRPVTSLEDCDRVLEVMSATWGSHQLVPRDVLRALGESGNVPFGAFDAERLIGFVLDWAGVDEEGLHVHSHQLASLPDRRHQGVGYALKLAQRARALSQGIHVVRWTFDPLVARNAYLNLSKLGAVADRFHRNFYGTMTDELNAGDRSDRLIARWALDSDPTAPRPVAAQGFPAVLVRGRGERPEPGDAPSPEGAVVEIPPEHAQLKKAVPASASAWRDATADAIEACLGAGLVATGFLRERSAYVFAPEGTST